MPDFIKLDKPGDSHTFKVMKVDVNTSGKWPSYNLHTEDGRIVSGPVASLDPQATRLGTTVPALLGLYVTVSRSMQLSKNGNPFWNVALASPGDIPEPSKRVAPPSKQEEAERTGIPPIANWASGGESSKARAAEEERQRAWLASTYIRLLNSLANDLETEAYRPSLTEVQPCAATLWIQYEKAGLLAVPPAAMLAAEAKNAKRIPSPFEEEPIDLERDEDLPF